MYPPEHRFYARPRAAQRRFQRKLGLLALGLLAVLGIPAMLWGWYALPALALVLLLTVLAPFFDVPSMVRRGKLIYHSPLFLAEPPRKGHIRIHGGTLFDYYFVLDRSLSGHQRTRFILRCYVEGLLDLIHTYEPSSEPLTIKGTSYIINRRTARRVGLRPVRTAPGQLLILLFNAVNLSCAYSLAKAQPALPPLHRVRTFEGQLGELAQQKDFLQRLHRQLQSPQADKP